MVFGQITADSTDTAAFEKRKGQLIVPADGYITAENCCVYQYNANTAFLTAEPIKNRLKVTCEANSQAITVAEGQVARIFKIRDYYVVIVKHGLYFSVYSNLEDARVILGQVVKEKQIVGTIKTTDNQTILDFELWFKTNKVNLIEWIGVN